MPPEIQALLDNRLLLSALSFVGGGILTNFVAVLRGRVRVLEYSVSHDRVGLSADDKVFGTVRISFQGVELDNLWLSKIRLENTTMKDYSKLVLTTYTGDNSKLMTCRTQLSGTPHALQHTPDYATKISVEAGATPTDEQWYMYNHRREFVVPVFNRGQQIEIEFLTTALQGELVPSVWMDLQHEGVRLRYRPNVLHVRGVPFRIAGAIGLVACLALVVVTSLFIEQPWLIATICMVAGLFAQIIGAYLYRAGRLAKDLVVR